MKRKYKFDPATKSFLEVDQAIPELHYVQDDTIPPTVSHATDEGKVFTSRSALYAHYRENGFEVSGGDHLTGRGVFDVKYKSDREDIRRDIQESARLIKWGMAPQTEKEKTLCQREEQNYTRWKKQNRLH